MLSAQGIAQRDVVLEASHGEHLALAMQEDQSRAGYLGGILFHGAVKAAYQRSFLLWCSRAVTTWEAREVFFWPSFCLSYLAGASHTQVDVSQHLCIQGWILQHALGAPCEYCHMAQGRQTYLGLHPRGLQVLSKIHTSLKHGVTVQGKSELSTSVCSDNAGIFYKNLLNGKTKFLCVGFQYFNLG